MEDIEPNELDHQINKIIHYLDTNTKSNLVKIGALVYCIKRFEGEVELVKRELTL